MPMRVGPSLLNQLHVVIMLCGQIYFHGLWLGVAWGSVVWKEAWLSVPLVDQSKTSMSCDLVAPWLPFP